MNKIMFIGFIFFSIKSYSTIYYVSNLGNDSSSGLTICETWLTINKVNSFSFSSGDSVLFRCNDKWNEKLIVPASNITFSSYGHGNSPLITGFKIQNGFTQSGNIWTTTATNAVKYLNTVMLNGKFAFKARYPNSTYITPIGPWTNTFVKTTLPDYPSYVGDEIVIRSTQWVLDVRKVTAQSAGVFYLSKNLLYPTTQGGRGIFFQNGVPLIDSIGEFAFDSSNKSLSVYSIDTPKVYISNIDTLVLINHKDNVTFENINFTGANLYTFRLDTSHKFTLKNCSINYSGGFGVFVRTLAI